MTRILTLPGSLDTPSIDPNGVAAFFDARARRLNEVGPLHAVIYQDKQGDLALRRDQAECNAPCLSFDWTVVNDSWTSAAEQVAGRHASHPWSRIITGSTSAKGYSPMPEASMAADRTAGSRASAPTNSHHPHSAREISIASYVPG